METVTLRQAIGEANELFVRSFLAADAAGVAKCYTPDARLFPPRSEPVSGTENIEAFWRAVMEMGIKEVKLESVELTELGESVYEVGQYTLRLADGAVADRGKYTVLWKKEAGAWKLHRDMWNTSVAPSA